MFGNVYLCCRRRYSQLSLSPFLLFSPGCLIFGLVFLLAASAQRKRAAQEAGGDETNLLLSLLPHTDPSQCRKPICQRFSWGRRDCASDQLLLEAAGHETRRHSSADRARASPLG